jgi:hypothetical protein
MRALIGRLILMTSGRARTLLMVNFCRCIEKRLCI